MKPKIFCVLCLQLVVFWQILKNKFSDFSRLEEEICDLIAINDLIFFELNIFDCDETWCGICSYV